MLPGERAAGSAYSFGVGAAKHEAATQQPRPHSSGFRTFLNWFKRVEVSRRGPERARSRTPELADSDSDSTGSETSTATAASFAFLPPAGYRPYGDALAPHKYIASGPYTDTYRRRVAERERRRRLDSGVTLRKKYHLQGADATLTPLREAHSPGPDPLDYDTFSLPAMSKRPAAAASEHRRAASETKFVRPTSYVHVKGKRRAPPPPAPDGAARTAPLSATLTRRVKRLAPQPPTQAPTSIQTPPTVPTPAPPVPTPAPPVATPTVPTPTPPTPTPAPTTPTTLLQDPKSPPSSLLQDPTSPPSSPKPLRISELLLCRQVKPTPQTYEPILAATPSSTTDHAAASCAPPVSTALQPSAPPFTVAPHITEEQPKESPSVLQPEASPTMSDRQRDIKKPVLLHSKSEESWKPPAAATVKENGELSPRPWYKRQFSESKAKSKLLNEEHKSRGKPELPEIGFFRYSKIFESKKNSTSPKSEDKRFSGPHALPNISELDREAAEILQMHKKSALEENNNVGRDAEMQSFANPRSARQLISKFNELNKGKPNGDSRGPNENIISRHKTTQPTALGPGKEATKVVNNLQTSAPQDAKLKSGDDTWVCMRCEKRNNNKKIICSSCFSRKPKEDDLFSKNMKEDLLQSFESEVLDALAHLGDMGRIETGNNKNVQTDRELNISKELAGAPLDQNEDREKLKHILREMKHSLPKQHKSGNNVEVSEQKKAGDIPGPSSSSTEAVKIENKPTSSQDPKVDFVSPLVKLQLKNDNESSPTSNVDIKESVTNDHTAIDEQKKSVNSSQIPSNAISVEINKVNIALMNSIGNSLYANVNVPVTKEPTPSTSSDVKNPKLLLKELEAAISKGDDQLAADIAKTLAQMKVNCTVLSSTATLVPQHSDQDVTVEVYIEDAESAAGPVRLRVSRGVTLPQLREAVQRQLDIPAAVQRWIVGKQLCVEDAPLSTYNGGDFTQPLFLYLVAPAKTEVDVKTDIKTPVLPTKSMENTEKSAKTNDDETNAIPVPSTSGAAVTTSSPGITSASAAQLPTADISSIENPSPPVVLADHYQQLVQLESRELIPNAEPFTCGVCLDTAGVDAGVLLRECLHAFCRVCLADTVRYCDTAQVLCPYRDAQYSCDSALQEREVRALVSAAEYEKHLAKSVQLAESNMRGTFHCKTADCGGWCVYENTVNIFRCPICSRTNCLTCQVIHEGENCAQYQERIRREAEGSGSSAAGAERTRRMLEDMCARGDALVCPSCQVVLMKKWGCDWVRCSMCKTEICWVTRGARWGPGGKGDTSAGCRCGVDGVKCHPSCNYCH